MTEDASTTTAASPGDSGLEAQLAQAREGWERYRLLVDNAGEGMLVVQDGRVVFHNRPLLQALGMSEQEFATADILDTVHSEDRDMARGVLLAEGGQEETRAGAAGHDLRFLGRDGLARQVRVRTVKLFWSGRPAVLHLLSDVTARRQAEEGLKASEERYRSLVENVPYGLCIAELPSTRFLFFNANACDMFGYSQEEGLELSIYSILDPAEVERARRGIMARMEKKGPVTRQVYDGVRKDGSRVRFEVRVEPVMYMGKPSIQGVLQDVTDQERLERQVQHAQKMEAVGTLAGGVAHEFNNLLMVISGYAQLLAQTPENVAFAANCAQKIKDSVRRASDLTKSMLSLSRKEPGERVPVQVGPLLRRLVGFLRQTLAHDMMVELSLPDDLPVIRANPNQIEQVVLNLTLNARDAMPHGGRMGLGARVGDLGEDFCRHHPWMRPGRYLEIRVDDSGEGMPPEVLERVFEPFFTTKAPGQGTGLGLAMVYTITKNHGGYVMAESDPGQGSSFRVFFPVEEGLGLARTEAQGGQRESRPGAGQRILVVDDEPALREICRRSLEGAGYSVDEAANGQEALDACRQAQDEGRPFALVVLDLAMPVMDGRECLLRLRHDHPGIKVLLASGHGKSQLSPEDIRAHTLGVLAKPYDLSRLIQMVAAALNPGGA
jgi:PAS domain S-box-containing protein